MSTSYIPPAGGGGLSFTTNVESLTGNKTIVIGVDPTHQYLNPNGANRTITIDTSSASIGDILVIRNTYNASSSPAYSLICGGTIGNIWPGATRSFVWSGTALLPNDVGTPISSTDVNISIGYNANANYQSVTIGYNANAGATFSGQSSVAVGYASKSDGQYSVAIGRDADAGGAGSVSIGYDATTSSNNAVAIGYSTLSASSSTTVGYDASSATNGSAFGYLSTASSQGSCFGYSSISASYATAVGYSTNAAKTSSVALGSRSITMRSGELSINFTNQTTQRDNMIDVGLYVATADATPTIMLAGGVAAERLTVRASSILSGKLIIVARDNISGECNTYHRSIAIKRDAAGNTALIGVVQDDLTIEEDASWDVAIAADDTNEALQITITGDATNPVQWAARFTGVETHF